MRVISEIELAYRFLPVPMVAVTGTNGKSTVTTALGLALEAAGIPARVGGNIGNPLIGEVDALGAARWVVAEISSFQLEWIETFRPRIAALLNLSEDHLDRYPTYEEYLRAKLRIFERMEAGDDLVLNADDPLVVERAAAARARAVWFSMRRIPRRGVYLFRGWIYSRLGERLGQRVLPVAEMRIAGTPQPGERPRRHGAGPARRLLAEARARGLPLLPRPAAPHRVRARGRRRALVRRLQGRRTSAPRRARSPGCRARWC